MGATGALNDRRRTRVGSGASSASVRLTLIGMAFMEQLFSVDEAVSAGHLPTSATSASWRRLFSI